VFLPFFHPLQRVMEKRTAEVQISARFEKHHYRNDSGTGALAPPYHVCQACAALAAMQATADGQLACNSMVSEQLPAKRIGFRATLHKI
ncbi:MAG: hypothetical protein LBS91_08485, partial [Clostridiales Family XIII bacterium]|nr:hypothetical protein [Clostridiales Family XIII bacterium]